MRVMLDTRKTVEQNAAAYFERAKKLRKKLDGAKRAILTAQSRMAEQTKTAPKEKEQHIPAREKMWFEKLRWFVSSDGFLCIGGRDAATNENIMKKHTQPGDLVFHTDMAGSPFVVVKAEGKPIPQTTLDEAAQFTAVYSRAWKNGFSFLEVFCATPDQFSKEPNPGEYLPKGAFMVRGKVTYFRPPVEAYIGKDEEHRVMCAPKHAVLQHCTTAMAILQGNDKPSDVAKRLAHMFTASVDDVLAALPSGGVKLGKEVKRNSLEQQHHANNHKEQTN